MSNNFKDDFEKNRQSIDTNSHQDHTEDVEKDQSELEHQDTIRIRSNSFRQEMPKRRKRRRDLTNHNKQVHNESQTSEDNVQNEAGTIDDRQVESSHSMKVKNLAIKTVHLNMKRNIMIECFCNG